MGKPKYHIPGFAEKISNYAEKRMLDFVQFSPFHMRVSDGGYTTLDVWSTGRYYIVTTDYAEMYDSAIVERQGEKGNIPVDNLWPFMDGIFFGADMAKEALVKE